MKTPIQFYTPGTRMREAIDDCNLLLLTLSRFGIPFGFGDKSIKEVCMESHVDIDTFISVANLVASKQSDNTAPIDLLTLINYLRKSHSYFLNFILPTIRRKLFDALYSSPSTDIALLILRYFDDYVLEVKSHTDYEDEKIFTRIEKLVAGESTESEASLEDYRTSHTDMGDKLTELKDIVVNYYNLGSNDTLNSVLYDLISCQNDLMEHCRIENTLLLPHATKLEKRIPSGKVFQDNVEAEKNEDSSSGVELLSEREKDVVRCVARGLANKEIADKLYLSINTITTYRRNIASKLNIHSPAGLTIFAILNNLIDIREIKL